MPHRRRATRPSLVACLVVVLGLVTAAGPVSAIHAPGNARAGSPADDGRGASGASGRLRGRLAQLVDAARAGTLDPAASRGFEVAPAPSGGGVGVSLLLAASGGEDALRALQASGARVANRSGETVEAWLPAAALRTLATLPGIERAEPIIRPVPLAAPGLGAVVGEGVKLHGAEVWQAAGIVGSGVKVGIIDGGFLGLTSRLGRELPASVNVRCYGQVGIYSSVSKSCETDTEHGTAVAETVADMAPGATLYLADPVSMLDLRSSVAWMTANGVQVINVSLGFAYEGPGDGTSPPGTVYSVVDQAVQGGALWVNAAGNAGQDGWTGAWKDSDQNGSLEFSGADERDSIVLAAGDHILVTLRWNDRWGASGNDYNLYVYGAGGVDPLAASEDRQAGQGDPVETISFTASTSGVYGIGIHRAGGSGPSTLQLLVLTSTEAPLQYRTDANTLPTPADSGNPGMITVGAVAFNSPDVIEPYSSRGPTTDGRIKPDLVAADCTATTLVDPFCGTSESAPYATGAAALALSADPSLTPDLLATWLRSHAVPLGGASPNATFGWGRLALGPPPEPSAPTALAVSAQPAVAVAGLSLSPAPVIRIVDQRGQVLSTGPGSSSPVSLALGPNPGGLTLTCAGGATRSAAAGVATFTGCSVSPPATGVTLVATSAGLSEATSAPFDVLQAGSAPSPGLTVTAAAPVVAWGGTAALHAQLASLPGLPLASPVSGRVLAFQASADGVAWQPVGTATTDDTGMAVLSIHPAVNMTYRAAFAGAPDLGPVVSGATRVSVRQTAVLRPTNGGRTVVIPRNRTIAFTTTVRPARSAVPAGTVTYEAYRLVGATWRRVLNSSVTPDAHGVATITITFNAPGRWYVRAIARPTSRNANSAWTPAEQFLVR